MYERQAKTIRDHIRRFGNRASITVDIPIRFDANGNYKNEFCFQWLETKSCKVEEVCPYAHDQSELTQRAIQRFHNQFKGKKCREFFQGSRSCQFGKDCLFHHDKRTFRQFHRRHYGSHLIAYEQLYESMSSDQAKSQYLENHVPETSRL